LKDLSRTFEVNEMAEFEFELEKGSKKFTCPYCDTPKKFKRYVRRSTGEYVSSEFGRCDRENECRKNIYPTKEFFSGNSERKVGLKIGKGKRKGRANYGFASKNVSQIIETPKDFDFIAFEYLKATLGNYDRNAFVQFLIDLFPDSIEEIQNVLTMYRVGTFDDYTCFPQIDRRGNICKAKLIRFNPMTGKRLKGDYDVSSLVRKLKLKEDFNYKQIFFGEHLLTKYPDKPVAIVEAEKSAIIASLCFPNLIWLGCNSKQWLKAERLQRLGNRKIILYPDADGFDQWQTIATQARGRGLDVKISSLIEDNATDEQKIEGYDLADYLIQQQREINQHNQCVYEPDEQDLLDARLEREAILEYENTASA
jgi:hypothetical protein